MSKSQDRLVTQRPDGTWANQRNDADRATSIHDTQRAAIDAARENLRKQSGGKIIIQGRDGQFLAKDTISPGRDASTPPRQKAALTGLATKPTSPPTSVVNVHEAKTQLSRLLARVAAGEEITIARAGHPFARLVPLATAATANPYLSLGIADALAAYDREHGQPEADFPEVWLHRTPPKANPLEE